MDIKTLLTIGHIIGVSIGVGAATVSDVFFIRILRNKKLTQADYDNLKVLSRMVWSGLALLILSGAGFLWRMYDASGSLGILQSDRFLAKLTLIAILAINGLIFHYKVFPIFKTVTGKSNELQKYKTIFSITGAISITSWYSIILLSTLRNLDLPYLGWMGAYAVLVLTGIITARIVIRRLLQK